MSTSELLIVVAIAWSTIGFIAAFFLGRLFRAAASERADRRDRLIC